ncbi:uncharacterized protein CTRU02_215079 [Colletotrichum truncatum]|uniref:Uncharacterized protein n=1 Tax=Colletotrichum truncatum TaxID=5467 RepID=A0ACC3YDG7_COLTU|nr:uncharacterized protein CTRU02_13733 [Colletotrichum truncatum]KAF6783081.1 hypothetical protein CTRU02_13733 [Colletotrichum truncatum]
MHRTIHRLCLSALVALALSAAVSAERHPFKCPTEIDRFIYATQLRRNAGYGLGDSLDSMDQVHNIMTKCSTIKSLKLRISCSGCSDCPDRYNFPFELPSGSHYSSQLEALDLEGYSFNEKPWKEAGKLQRYGNTADQYLNWLYYGNAWIWLKGLRLSEAQRNLTNLDLWLGAMDFSKIESLSIRSDGALASMIPHLKSLKSFTASGAWAKDFILALPSNTLAHLSWLNSGQTGASVSPIIRSHAYSLRSLEWREYELLQRQRRVMTADQLSDLGSMAPNLRSLTFDINQNGTWGWDHLEALATKFPNLENATIFLEEASECRRQLEQAKQQLMSWREMRMIEDKSTCQGADSFANPHLSASEARAPFEFLLKENADIDRKLQKVEFFSGGRERGWDGPLTVDEDWLQDHQSWALCEVVDGDGGPGEGFKQVAALEKGEKLIICQDDMEKWHKLLSDVKHRETNWTRERLGE